VFLGIMKWLAAVVAAVVVVLVAVYLLLALGPRRAVEYYYGPDSRLGGFSLYAIARRVRRSVPRSGDRQRLSSLPSVGDGGVLHGVL